jgi:Protein of unknown function (DUF2867)
MARQEVREVPFPPESRLAVRLASASFHDAYATPFRGSVLSPVEVFLHATAATPGWVDGLMGLRNRLVQLAGLKNVGPMSFRPTKSAAEYGPGDRLGIFTVRTVSTQELVLGIDDRHLDVNVSILVRETAVPEYVVSTIVHTHNALGRAYMLPVSRVHPYVVRAMMTRAAL